MTDISVSHQTPAANIGALVNGEAVGGDQIWLSSGGVLTLDGSGSTTPVSAVAFLCPAEAEQAIPAVAIGEYLWDLDSDGEIDETGIETSNVALDELDRLPSTAAVTSRCVAQTRGSSVVR